MILSSLSAWGDAMRERFAKMSANREQDALGIAGDLKALVQLRIQTTGMAYTGSALSPYSPEYAKRRAKGGLQNTVVDYTVTGQMWGNIRPEVVESSANAVVVDIAARTRNNQMKLAGARKG